MELLGKYTLEAQNLINDKKYDEAVSMLDKAIANKEYEASSIIGMLYLTGLYVEKDINKGLDYLNIGLNNNDPKSISALGDCYYNGKYIDVDLAKAKELYQKASMYNEPHAIGMLGLFLYNDKNYTDAVSYFKTGVALYDNNSMYYLGICAYNGYGMDTDYELAYMLFSKLYEDNRSNKELNKFLAEMYFNGYGVNKDIEKAKELYMGLDDNESIFNLALIYKNFDNDYLKAKDLFMKVKTVESQFELGLMYYNGLGVEENKAEAYFKFYACAMSKYPYSYPFLGDCYYYGYGVKKDNNEAIKWYKNAIKENINNQHINLAVVYASIKEYDLAIDELLKENDSINKYRMLANCYIKKKKYDLAYNAYMYCANLNDISSTYEIYKMLKKGKGVEKDKEKANLFYLKYVELSTLSNGENK